MSQKLTSMPALVESPFIIVKIGNYEFGSYQSDKVAYSKSGAYKSVYPNYMKDMQITKINGEVNNYTINMVYQISRGDDPNFLEKVFSSVAKNRKILISYGDWASPNYIYKEESAIITDVKSSADIRSSNISYSISCISDTLPVLSKRMSYPPVSGKKGSTVINELLNKVSQGFTQAFPGMKSVISPPYRTDLIASDDKEIDLEGKQNTTPWEYLQYVVNSMASAVDKNYADSQYSKSYYLSINGDNNSEYGGPYFKVSSVSNDTKTITSGDSFEIDVNFPGDNFVTEFSVTNDQTWSLLYDYTMEDESENYRYSIGANGQIETTYAPNTTISNYYNKPTAENTAWWKKVTEFPITARMVLRGLTRPAILMSYIKINVYFYGIKSIYSGWYIITEQRDSISSGGYKTELSLTRVGSDSALSIV